jgi:hypothetical protein
MKNLRSVVLALAIGTAAAVVGCMVKKNDTPVVVSPGWHYDGTYLVSTFQGTFSIGRSRVRAAEKSTDLVVAKLDGRGQSQWMRAFAGLAPGKAVASAQVGKNVAVVGVFAGNFQFDRQDQLLKSGNREGLFVAVFDPTGRAISANLLARADRLAAPDVVAQGDRVSVNIPYEGAGDVGGKELPKGTGQTLLRLTVSNDGKLIGFEPPRASLDRTLPSGKIVQGTFVDEKPAPGTGLVMASMQSSVCDVCVVNQPRTDPNCATCRNLVCPGDSWCCSSGWDRICMNEAITMCSPIQCSCPHGTCTAGAWMHPNCDNGTARNTCVRAISAGDSYCTSTAWDGMCNSESLTWCVAPGCH